MQGKHIAVTGPTSGIGHHTSVELARRGAQLTLFCRNPDKGAALQEEILAVGGSNPTVIIMDMASLDSVREAAQQCLAQKLPLDVLINNAGVVNLHRNETVDGFEETLAVNHFAPFLLTGLLLPLLQEAAPSRIVNVASDAHAFVRDMGFDDMQAQKSYKVTREYGRSKLANILFTRSLATRLEGSGVTVNSLHPGAVSTGLGTQNGGIIGKVVPLLLKPFFRTPEQGAATSLHLACSAEVADISGAYFVKCKAVKAKPWAYDDEAARLLWEYTEECVDFRYVV